MSRQLFGAFLVAEGLITEEQLQIALRHQARLRQTRIGDLLVTLGAISRDTLERAVRAQLEESGARRRIGDYLVDEELVRREDIDRALARQADDRGKRLGELLVELGFLRRQDLDRAIAAQLEERANA
jgi:hypothetical protein